MSELSVPKYVELSNSAKLSRQTIFSHSLIFRVRSMYIFNRCFSGKISYQKVAANVFIHCICNYHV